MMANNPSVQYTIDSNHGHGAPSTFTISPTKRIPQAIPFGSPNPSTNNKRRHAPPIKRRPLPNMPSKPLPNRPLPAVGTSMGDSHSFCYTPTQRLPIAKPILHNHNSQGSNHHQHSRSMLPVLPKKKKQKKPSTPTLSTTNDTCTSPHTRSHSANVGLTLRHMTSADLGLSHPETIQEGTAFSFDTKSPSPQHSPQSSTSRNSRDRRTSSSAECMSQAGNAQTASYTYQHVPPAPMKDTPHDSVSYFFAPGTKHPIARVVDIDPNSKREDMYKHAPKEVKHSQPSSPLLVKHTHTLPQESKIDNDRMKELKHSHTPTLQQQQKEIFTHTDERMKEVKHAQPSAPLLVKHTHTLPQESKIDNDRMKELKRSHTPTLQQQKEIFNRRQLQDVPPPPPPPLQVVQDDDVPPPPPTIPRVRSCTENKDEILKSRTFKQMGGSCFIHKEDLQDTQQDSTSDTYESDDTLSNMVIGTPHVPHSASLSTKRKSSKKLRKKQKRHTMGEGGDHMERSKATRARQQAKKKKQRRVRNRSHRKSKSSNALTMPSLIEQSQSTNETQQRSTVAHEPEERKMQMNRKENEDWQIMGDLLFSIRHSLICRTHESEYNRYANEYQEPSKKKKKKKKKEHLEVTQNEWQSFIFDEFAGNMFAVMRGKWLQCATYSDTYVRRLFGDSDESVPVQKLEINKSCKYYWRRLNTNSKSGQIFFQTVNGEYIIKSMPKSEAEFFRKSFLEKYYDYMLAEPDALLMRIMGCYKIQYKKTEMNLASNNEYNARRKQDVNKGVYVIVMKSILFCELTPTVKMHKIYDLKGSKHNRTASRYKLEITQQAFDALNKIDEVQFEEEAFDATENVKRMSNSYSEGFYQPRETEDLSKFKRDRKGGRGRGPITVYKRSKVLKDIDFMQDNEILNVGEVLKDAYLAQLRADLHFLCKMNVMDYSLLVGIHRHETIVDKKNRSEKGHLFTFEFGGMCETIKNGLHRGRQHNIYFTGIIDFLQAYNTKKKLESYYKRYKVADGKEAISSVDAKTYANRLYDFIEKRMI
eukprot:821339_1